MKNINKLILAFFLILYSSNIYAQIKYDLFIEITDGKINGKVFLSTDKEDIIKLYTKGLKIKEINKNYINIKLKKNSIKSIQFSYTPPNNNTDFINGEYIYLTGNWYPVPDKDVIYTLKVSVPAGFTVISEAEKISKVINGNRTLYKFEFPYPLDKIHIIGSKKYEIYKENYNGISIEAYFFSRDFKYGKKYVKTVKEYIKEYEKLITDFPYKRFAVVENIFQTGYSMPTFTLIGDTLIKYPFIINQSLRHELVHQWFGNYVYIDFSRGNWAEGLTTYLSDHYSYEKRNLGHIYRKDILIKYTAYVNQDNEYPVSKFVYKKNKVSEAIGYGKVMFVFHMLKKYIGEETFFTGLRKIVRKYRFKHISWDEIRSVFETTSGKDLSWFFNQWVYKKGIANISIKDIELKLSRGRFLLSFEQLQEQNFNIKVPVYIETTFKKIKREFNISQKKQQIKLSLKDEPLAVVIDPEYDIFRKLSKEERPPVIADILAKKDLIAVIPTGKKEKYIKILKLFSDKKVKTVTPEKVDLKLLKKKSFILFDVENQLISRLFAGTKVDKDLFSVYAHENPLNYKHFSLIIHSPSKEFTDRVYYRLIHYGKYSFITIDPQNKVEKGKYKTENGIVFPVRNISKAVPVRKTVNIKDLTSKIENKKIIYVGEQHTNFAHHIVQLNIIKGIFHRHKKLAIGMEMFQRKFQPVIDKYINGEISEKEFLKKTEYFKRWGFDYNLYKPIIDFARENRIPIIALNIETEILKKVSSKGLESLTKDELEKIPKELDFSNEKYKSIIKKIFNIHQTNKQFEHFFQSQILWDETMAESIDRFLKSNKGYKMVVIAGNGHLKYGFGIPERCYRRNGFDYTVILNDEELDDNIGDYIFYPENIEGEKSPKLGVFLEESKKGLIVKKVIKGSLARKIGLKKGDIILSVNGNEVKTVTDLKVELFFFEKGKKFTITIKRGEKKKELTGIF